MNLVSIEAPTARVALTRETSELLDAALGIVSPSDGLQVIADQLIQALAQGLRFFSSPSDKLLVDGEGYIH